MNITSVSIKNKVISGVSVIAVHVTYQNGQRIWNKLYTVKEVKDNGLIAILCLELEIERSAKLGSPTIAGMLMDLLELLDKKK